MKKIDLAMLLVILAIIASLYAPNGLDHAELSSNNTANETAACIPDTEYFIDCTVHNETRINTTLLIHGKTIFVENVALGDHPDIWETVLSDFPPHATERIIKIVFNDSTPSNKSALMVSDWEAYPGIFCDPKWIYSQCNLDVIRVRDNASIFNGAPMVYYKSTIAHEVGHSIRINYSDRDIFSELHGFNKTADNFISKYSMTSNQSEKEDFAENIRFWRGNTALLWKISHRNEIMRGKFEIVSRQICYSKSDNMTLCPIYISQNAKTDAPLYYNGTANNYKGLFNEDLRRKDVVINKYIRNLIFEDFNSSMTDFENNGT